METKEVERTCFPFFIGSMVCDSEDEAWESFYFHAENDFNWIVGKKIWRTAPECRSDHRIDEDRHVFVVAARAIALKELPHGMQEAIIRGPYPENPIFDGDETFGLASSIRYVAWDSSL